MAVFILILGAIFGAALMDQRWFFGVVSGALTAYLLYAHGRLRGEFQTLRRKFDELAMTPTTTESAKPAEPEEVIEDDREQTLAAYREQQDTPPAEAAELKTIEPEPGPEFHAPVEPVSTPASTQTGPDPIDRGVAAVREFIFGGNTAVRVGAIILFFGVGFLLKYAAEHSKFPIEYRFIATAIGAMALLVFGWRLRERKRSYALVLQGTAIGIMYLTVFTAFRLYHLLPPTLTFAFLVALVAISALLAVLQNAMALAAFGAAGGFLAPVLTSTGGGNHIYLFSYYTILNLGIVAIAWFKAWRPLNLVGFIFTFGVATAWGAKNYQHELFASTEPFLVIFFVVYLLTGVLFATRQKPDLKGYVDGTLVFGTPLVSFGLQVKLMEPYEYGLAFTALGAGAVYVMLATIMFRRGKETMRLFTEALLAVGVVFLSLAIPLALDGRWTSAAWALEGAGIMWVGVRQQRWLARAFGALLQFGAAAFFLEDIGQPVADQIVFNGFYLGTLILTFAALFTSWYLDKSKSRLSAGEEPVSALFLMLGAAWWFGGGLREISQHLAGAYESVWQMSFIALSAAGFYLIARRLRWNTAALVSIVLLPATVLATGYSLIRFSHPMDQGWWLVWSIVFVVAYGLLFHAAKTYTDSIHLSHFCAGCHTTLYWIGLLLITAESLYWVQYWLGFANIWAKITPVGVAALVLLVTLSRFVGKQWPVKNYKGTYYGSATLPVVVILLGWAMMANIIYDGSAAPLPYIPLINPLELAIAFCFVVAIKWHLVSRRTFADRWVGDTKREVMLILAGMIFLWLNGILIRSLHHWADVPYRMNAIFNSVLVQASLSVFWATLGLVAMWSGSRIKQRAVWLGGAALLGLTVIKLFVVDLSNTGTIARIVSFIAVGILLLVVGYLSPAPPKKEKVKEKEAVA